MKMNCPSCSSSFEIGRLQQKRGEAICPECGKNTDIFKMQADALEQKEKPPEPNLGIPVDTKITFEIMPDEWLEMDIPPEGWKPFAYVLIGGGALTFIFSIVISIWFIMESITFVMQFLPLAMIAAAVYLLLWGFFYAYGKTRIYFDKENLKCTRSVFNLKWTSSMPTVLITKVKPIPYSTKAENFIPCVIGKAKRIRFGQWLTPEEQGWVCKVIGNFLTLTRMEDE